jgi:molybdopterin converting factor subunit 1
LRVKVRLFAVQRELAGTREVLLDLADDADVEAAWAALVARHPVLAPGRPSVRFARNGDYADPTTPLTDGDEVAMIPPVSGGAGAPDGGGRRILVIRSRPRSSPSWPTPSRFPRTARSSASSAGRARRPGRPRRGRRLRPPGTRGGASNRSTTRRTR